MVQAGDPEGDGIKRGKDFAQHADAGVGGRVRPNRDDDVLRDADDEFIGVGTGAVGDHNQVVQELSGGDCVVDGQRGKGLAVASAG